MGELSTNNDFNIFYWESQESLNTFQEELSNLDAMHVYANLMNTGEGEDLQGSALKMPHKNNFMAISEQFVNANFSVNDQSMSIQDHCLEFDPPSVGSDYTPLIDSVPQDVPSFGTEVLNQRSEEFSQVDRVAGCEIIERGNLYHPPIPTKKVTLIGNEIIYEKSQVSMQGNLYHPDGLSQVEGDGLYVMNNVERDRQRAMSFEIPTRKVIVKGNEIIYARSQVAMYLRDGKTHSHCNGINCAIFGMKNLVPDFYFPLYSLTLHPTLERCSEVILTSLHKVFDDNLNLKCLFYTFKNDKRGRHRLYDNKNKEENLYSSSLGEMEHLPEEHPLMNNNKEEGALKQRKSAQKKRDALTNAFEAKNMKENFYNASLDKMEHLLEGHPEHGTACVTCSFRQNIQQIKDFVSAVERVNIEEFWTTEMTIQERKGRGVDTKSKKAVNTETFRKRKQLLKDNYEQMGELYRKLTHHLSSWRSLVQLCTTLIETEGIALGGSVANHSELYNESNSYEANFGH